MAGFLYFVPAGREGTFRDTLEEWGFGYVVERGLSVAPLLGAGPSGVGGLIAADESTVPQITFDVNAQSWIPSDRELPKDGDETSRPWVGMSNKNPPKPLELLRDDALDGHFVKLADGAEWLIPIARGFTDVPEIGPINSGRLPHAIRRVGGAWIRDGVVAKYAALWDGALAWWKYYTEAVDAVKLDADDALKRVPFDFDKSLDLAAAALQANYRVGTDEIGLAALFNEALVRDVLLAVIDWPFVRTWVEKKKGSGSITGG